MNAAVEKSKAWNRWIREHYDEVREKRLKRTRAHSEVNKAIAEGRLQRKPCKICGELETEGHHTDYDKPLNVVWLCREHHTKAHMKLKRNHLPKELQKEYGEIDRMCKEQHKKYKKKRRKLNA